jgi:hypothetical protein
MSIVNGTDWPIIPSTTSGTELADRLNRLFAAIQSNQANTTRPLQLTAGGIWTRTETNGDLILFFYDGTTDYEIGSVSGGTGAFGSGGPLALAFDQTKSYFKGNIIYDAPTKVYYSAVKDIDANNPYNAAEWQALDDVLNQLEDYCKVDVQSTPPTNYFDGKMYYDTTDPSTPVLKIFYDGAWHEVCNDGGEGGGPGGGGEGTVVESEVLVIGGGGGGGTSSFASSGGAGAGGLITRPFSANDAYSYIIVVGAGGAAGTNGGKTSAFSMTALGGGHGGGNVNPPNGTFYGGSGGSGGGGAVAGSQGSGTAGQGFSGGGGRTDPFSGGGGGGAGAVGTSSAATGGSGGIGVQSSITGTAKYYAGGGGGGGSNTSGGQPGQLPGPGGNGGGGYGGYGGPDGSGSVSADGVAGTAGLGGGGGGGARVDQYGYTTGGTGGSGVVIFAYPGTEPKFVGGDTISTTSRSGYVVHTFTSSGTLGPLPAKIL